MPYKSLIDLDSWLKPFEKVINQREKYVQDKIKTVLDGSSIVNFAQGYNHFGLHVENGEWVFREWAPNATRVYLVGDFSNWQDLDAFALERTEHGQWVGKFPIDSIEHGLKYKLHIYWNGGDGWRIPSYATRVVQDTESHDFSTEVWSPKKPYSWRNSSPKTPEVPLIYEAHVGMSSEEPKVSSFNEFTKNILPRIKKAGYNTVQLMAVQEHPYYGSFGYHVSNFFAVSSRFGTPDDFKKLVDNAHQLGLRVIIDIVHSHAVKNEIEGLSRFDGTTDLYFRSGERGDHPAWDSRVFDYGKPEVLHFLLSNCRYWLEEYHLDGFRFDGITSMLYSHHGLEKAFSEYADYYHEDVEKDTLVYLRMANQLIHAVDPESTTIAEEMSGLPGVGAPVDSGGLGFDYRLAMGGPDLWIKTLKERKDEEWNLGEIYHVLSSHRPEEKVINYAESHDQALVGDKTLIFRLIDQEMYWHMQKTDENIVVERGIALHKMIRLLTIATNGGGYLNFMGNEFGHPEWIDFPREGNDWSYQYAKRQWSLVDDPLLKYDWLSKFDQLMLTVGKELTDPQMHYIEVNEQSRLISFYRNNYLFAFNFSPSVSLTGHRILAPEGSYEIALTTDSEQTGGQNRIDETIQFFSKRQNNQTFIQVYLPARTAIVLKRID